jgi:hypothetical protein
MPWLFAASVALAPAVAQSVPNLSICFSTETESGEHTDCPDPSADPVFRFVDSTWQPPGPTTATVTGAVSAAWSVLEGSASVFARYDHDADTGFSNDFNSSTAILDATDFVVTGPPGPVTFTLNVFVDGAAVATSTDPARFPSTAGVDIEGMIFQTGQPNCTLEIGGGDISSASTPGGFGVYADHIGGSALFTSDPCTVETGAPVRILLSLSAGVSLTTPFADDLPHAGAEGNASVRFVAGFPTNGPVMNLPQGYTASSVSALVVENGYVPEPGALATSASALAALAHVSVRRPRRDPG